MRSSRTLMLVLAIVALHPSVALLTPLGEDRRSAMRGWSTGSRTTAPGQLRLRGGSDLGDHRGVAANLFNNMRTPAALISGAIVPLGLLAAPKIEPGDSKKMKLLKRAHQLLALASMYNQLLAITYSTIAVNKLAEVNHGPTKSVVELLGRDYELAWIGTNLHFLAGLAGFGIMVGLRPLFSFGVTSAVGRVAVLWTAAALLAGMSIVNRGIALGDGTVGREGGRFADNLFTLGVRYCVLLARDAHGVLSLLAGAVLALSVLVMCAPLVRGSGSAAASRDACHTS